MSFFFFSVFVVVVFVCLLFLFRFVLFFFFLRCRLKVVSGILYLAMRWEHLAGMRLSRWRTKYIGWVRFANNSNWSPIHFYFVPGLLWICLFEEWLFPIRTKSSAIFHGKLRIFVWAFSSVLLPLRASHSWCLTIVDKFDTEILINLDSEISFLRLEEYRVINVLPKPTLVTPLWKVTGLWVHFSFTRTPPL